MAGDGLLSLRWNNHRTSFMQVLSSLWDKHKYSDVTLACAGKFYNVHKFVLSTCSDYFLDIVENTPCTHPTIVLKDIRAQDLEALLNYMYLGEVNVLQTDLSRLIKAAECLRIKGLAVPDESPPQYHDEARVGQSGDEGTHTPQSKRRRHDDDSTNSLPSPTRKKRSVRPHSADLSDQDQVGGREQEGDSEGSGRESHDHLSTTTSLLNTTANLTTSPNSTLRDSHTTQGSLCETRIKTEEQEEEVKCETEPNEAGDACMAALEVQLGHPDPGQTSQQPLTTPAPPLLPQPYPSQPQSFEEIVSQALPGPSGMQADGVGSGWDGNRVKGDMTPFHLQGFTQQMEVLEDSVHRMRGSVCTEGGLAAGACAVGQFGMEIIPQLSSSSSSDSSRLDLDPGRSYRMWRCLYPDCGYTTDRESWLKQHFRKHTGEKPYSCPFCSFRSAQKGNLNVHIKRVHYGGLQPQPQPQQQKSQQQQPQLQLPQQPKPQQQPPPQQLPQQPKQPQPQLQLPQQPKPQQPQPQQQQPQPPKPQQQPQLPPLPLLPPPTSNAQSLNKSSLNST